MNPELITNEKIIMKSGSDCIWWDNRLNRTSYR